MKLNPNVGATDELSLRVSVATLVRVLYQDPGTGEWMLALERKATLREQTVDVKVQPFGGAVRINNLSVIDKITGGFHFDSERSQEEQDFRILVRPSAWEAVKAFCLEQFQASNETALETSPARELAEEIHDSLRIQIDPDQYICYPLWTVVENIPSPTANIHAVGQPTARIYRVSEARIVDEALWQKIALNSNSLTDQDLQNQARKDRHNGGKGRANACSIVPMNSLRQYYSSRSRDEHGETSFHQGTILERNISALLDGCMSSSYQLIHD